MNNISMAKVEKEIEELMKCDICGVLYEDYGRDSRGNSKKPNSLMLTCRDYYNANYMRMEFYDCCPSCMHRIQTLIDSIRVPAELNDRKEGNDGNKN